MFHEYSKLKVNLSALYIPLPKFIWDNTSDQHAAVSICTMSYINAQNRVLIFLIQLFPKLGLDSQDESICWDVWDHFPLELYTIARDHMALHKGWPQPQLQRVGHFGYRAIFNPPACISDILFS